MLVYITSGQKTDITTINMDGLPLHHLSVGRGYFARRRAVRWLRELHASGVRRCVCADAALLPLAEQVDITPYPVLPLRLALLDGLLDVLCPGGLQNAAVLLRCGRGGRPLPAPPRLFSPAAPGICRWTTHPICWRRSCCTAGASRPATGAGWRR